MAGHDAIDGEQRPRSISGPAKGTIPSQWTVGLARGADLLRSFALLRLPRQVSRQVLVDNDRLEGIKYCRTLLSMRDVRYRYFGFVAFLLTLIPAGVGARAVRPTQATGSDYLVPFPAHHVIGNVYFVGSKALGIYLVTTLQGHILINAGLEDSVSMI